MEEHYLDLLSLAEVYRDDRYRSAIAALLLAYHPKTAWDIHTVLPAPANASARPQDWLWLRGELDAWATRALA